jgi:hypothetical protein
MYEYIPFRRLEGNSPTYLAYGIWIEKDLLDRLILSIQVLVRLREQIIIF